MRDVHNKVFAELDVYQDAINDLYARNDDDLPAWSVSKLWQEYVE